MYKLPIPHCELSKKCPICQNLPKIDRNRRIFIHPEFFWFPAACCFHLLQQTGYVAIRAVADFHGYDGCAVYMLAHFDQSADGGAHHFDAAD